jgi:ABC-type ATPase with predicted acetyltransferase domain
MRLDVAYQFLPKQRSLNTSLVMDLFGIDFDAGRFSVAEGVELAPQPGEVVFFTGPSGSGKSSLLRAAAGILAAEPNTLVIWPEALTWQERPLVDVLPLPIEQSLALLSACGLGEARLMLRTPAELSDGQRYRFRLALGLAQLAGRGGGAGWLAADEFSANLDRPLARVLAASVRKLARAHRVGFLLATTHDDVLDDLRPDWLVRCDLDGGVEVARPELAGETPRFFGSAGSARAPVPIGRTSLGGIIAATTSLSCAG